MKTPTMHHSSFYSLPVPVGGYHQFR